MSFASAFQVLFIVSVLHLVISHSHNSLMGSVHDEKNHIQFHLNGEISAPNLNQMAEDELRFLYFKMHDGNEDNRLDGCELIKSLLHWHEEEHKTMEHDALDFQTTRIFGNDELSLLIDPILSLDDRNLDGFIDYPEFVAAQKSRGF